MSRLSYREETSSRSSSSSSSSDDEKESTSRVSEKKPQQVKSDEASSNTVAAAKVSPWLVSFLQQKRVPTAGEVPEFGPMRDTYLREFHTQITQEKTDTVLSTDIEGRDEVILLEDRKVVDGRVRPLSPSSSVASSPVHEAQHVVADEDGDWVRIFNLPYKMTTEQVIDCATDCGVVVLHARLDIDRTGAPAGSASIKIPVSAV